MKRVLQRVLPFALNILLFASSALAQTTVPSSPASDQRQSGNAFLSPAMLALQKDSTSNPLSLWIDRGQGLWREGSTSCQSCHGDLGSMKQAATRYPRLTPDGVRLINLEDQIVSCRSRSGHAGTALESEEVLALSAALHSAAAGLPLQVAPEPDQREVWQARLAQGARRYVTRMGRMNLACTHCHDQRVGAQMRADVISPAHPTGFPIYRMSWQTAGSIDRRLRACYSGVQAQLPAPGSAELRALELYLKVRAAGMPLDGPSLRR
jgi:sulfur-oxidizing protein SoxA